MILKNELLIFNLKEDGANGPSWDYIPEDIWQLILTEFIAKYCDSFGLDCIEDEAALKDIMPFRNDQPKLLKLKKYSPFHLPNNLPKDQWMGYKSDSPSFELTPDAIKSFKAIELGCWNAGNDETPADELVFWQGEYEKVLAIPYEGMIYFSNLTDTEREQLVSLDPRIIKNLHAA